MTKDNSSAAGAAPLTAGHTPGPWQAIGTDPNEGGDFFWLTACPVSNQEKEIGTISGPQNDVRNAANARLIAAAPDLLEALKRATDWIANTKEGRQSNICQILRAAIAKAEGR